MAECHLQLPGNSQRCWLELKDIFHDSSQGAHIFHTLSGRKTAKMWCLWCYCSVLSFLGQTGNINGGRSVDTPTPAALLILLHSPLCTNHTAQQPGGRQALSSASEELRARQQWKAHGQDPCSQSCSLHGGSPAAPRAGLWTVLPWKDGKAQRNPVQVYGSWRPCL